jgi:hypothetical protein
MSCGMPTTRSIPQGSGKIVTGDLPPMAEAAEAALLRLEKAQKS